jgi:bifunctional DNase/RNase
MRATSSKFRRSSLLLLAGICTFLLAARKSSEPSEKRNDRPTADRVEMEVLVVIPINESSSVVVLRDRAGGVLLPIFIGQAEGLAIALRLKQASLDRPLTHDLLSTTIAALGARIVRIEIDSLQESVFRASMILAQGKRILRLDARPSDSIALALGAGAPILVARKVLDDAGFTEDELEQLRKGRDDREREENPGNGDLPQGMDRPLSL